MHKTSYKVESIKLKEASVRGTLQTFNFQLSTAACAEAVHSRIGSHGTTSPFTHTPYARAVQPAHKPGVYAPRIAQESYAKAGAYEQLLAHIYRLAEGVVHILHRPYRNYNYVIN